MKVTLTKHGGLAATIRRPPCIVEESNLTDAQKADLARLIAALKVEPTVPTEPAAKTRDEMTYIVSLAESGEVTEFRQTDLKMSKAFAQLMSWLEKCPTRNSP